MSKPLITIILMALSFSVFSQNGQVTTTTGTAESLYYKDGNLGIGTSSPNRKLSIYGGNISISNGEHSTIYSSAHNLYFSGPANGYAHKGYTFRPAWGAQGSTFSYLALQTADTQGNFTTRTLLNSSGTSYINGGSLGIGTTTTGSHKLAVEGTIGAREISLSGGNISISNDEESTIYSSAHNLYFSGLANGYAHKVYTFRPAWGVSGSTFSCLAIQTADTQGNFITKTLLHSSGTSYINGGSLGVGTTDTKGFKLAVNGKIGADEIQVKANYWSDFVFENDYELKDLEEVESFIKENKHLPDVPSEKEVLENGIQLGEMDAKLLQKIEELTLYVIEQNKKTNRVIEENKELREEIEALKINIKKQ